jgi:hypothetical protein
VLTTALSVGCGSSASSPPPAADVYNSPHFRFAYTPLDRNNISSIADSVEAQYARIVSDLQSDALPTVNVTFYSDHANLVAATAPVAGVVPDWASGLATAQDQIHLMSPNAPAWGPYDRMVSNLVHEFAHCVSMHINTRIPNNPRWFWESVAIYESGQFVDPRTLAYMRDGQAPSFASLNSFDNTRVYEVGYTIAEFIVSRWGREALNRLIASNANVDVTLGISQPAFEQQWLAFVRQRYGV